MSDVPEDVRREISELQIKATGSTQNSSQAVVRQAQQIRVHGGTWFGARWCMSTDQLVISWPTFRIAAPFGSLGLVLCGAMSLNAILMPEKHGDRWPWIIGGFAVCIILLISMAFLREKIAISVQSISRTRWPAFLVRPRHAAPAANVLNAIVEMKWVHGKHTRRIGTVRIRVKRPSDIEWWDISTDMSWNEAERIGRQLSRFIDVRFERDE